MLRYDSAFPGPNFNQESGAMKTMVVWSAKPGGLREAVSRFLAGQANPPAGVLKFGLREVARCLLNLNCARCRRVQDSLDFDLPRIEELSNL
jgi:hypothetical protein